VICRLVSARRVGVTPSHGSFGENDNGELYVVTIDGRLLRVLAS
jgi:hypothetical protein